MTRGSLDVQRCAVLGLSVTLPRSQHDSWRPQCASHMVVGFFVHSLAVDMARGALDGLGLLDTLPRLVIMACGVRPLALFNTLLSSSVLSPALQHACLEAPSARAIESSVLTTHGCPCVVLAVRAAC